MQENVLRKYTLNMKEKRGRMFAKYSQMIQRKNYTGILLGKYN